MKLVHTIAQMQAISRNWPADTTIGFVPTMGYLHEGHLSLVRESIIQCGITVVSIFVNPSQFGPNEDLSRYPRDLERDLELLSAFTVDYVFFPTNEQMYPATYHTWVNVEQLSEVLCGASRPGHFRGVATIVLKLVNIIKPDFMFMGEKDFQQVTVLTAMLNDLNLDCRIAPCPIVREADGLALSSRNIFLKGEERKQALCLSAAISQTQQLYAQGTRKAALLLEAATKIIADAGGNVDYIYLVNPQSLQSETDLQDNTRIIMAVYIGKTRLIDNAALYSPCLEKFGSQIAQISV
ncbi:MAG: pantoate--beta-alanine ligase [Candidatus Cloacimonas sp.]|jgi:pantoate--beta-alanine ligase|nr:pantoate--beta-alanine ligase [Candidatus Cloacimonas sp.]